VSDVAGAKSLDGWTAPHLRVCRESKIEEATHFTEKENLVAFFAEAYVDFLSI
jgi:hypothetical protein